jgi:D-tyrosyl-tRNA(Tyr) deacylase
LIALIQRVTQAEVRVENRVVGSIGPGTLALIGVQRDDNERSADRLLERILTYRIFSDDNGRMNRSLRDTGGGLLLVSQFTLVADTQNGTRAGFSRGAAPGDARRLFDYLVQQARAAHPAVATGEFAADMKVSLTNDGPVTFWLEANSASQPNPETG